MTYGYPPQQPMQQHQTHPPQKKSRTGLFVAAVIGVPILLCGVGGCIALASSGSDKPAVVASGAPSARGGVAPAGSMVRDGKFEFVVTAIDAPVKTVGDNEFLQQTAQGDYILVHVTVSNIGDQPRGYYGGNQKLVDVEGRKFTNDSRAEMNVNDHLTTDINPGNQVAAVLVFDVPAGAQPATLELHDSAFSGGAKVALR